jgi:hypothetical protein
MGLFCLPLFLFGHLGHNPPSFVAHSAQGPAAAGLFLVELFEGGAPGHAPPPGRRLPARTHNAAIRFSEGVVSGAIGNGTIIGY